jgi:outer membrane protein OmpA-like peptidoglycan-associated protein
VAFCEKCGNQVIAGAAFCPKCGARTGSSAQANPTTPSPPVVQPAAAPVTPVAATVPASNNSGGCGKALLIVGIVVLLCAALGIAGVVYVGYRAKKKVDEIKQEITGEDRKATSDQSAREKNAQPQPAGPAEKDTADEKGPKGSGLLDQVFGDSQPLPMYVDDVPESFMVGNSPATSCPEYSGAIPSQGPTDKVDPGKIPLKPGMRIVNSWRRFNGDVENILTINSVEKDKVTFDNSGTGFATNTSVDGTKQDTSRTLCRNDLVAARIYITEHESDFPNIFPGTTSFTMPLQLFQQVKSAGKIHWEYREYFGMGSPARFVPYPWQGDLTRVEPQDVPFPLILNDQQVQVPTIHLKGNFDFSGASKLKKLLPPSFGDHQETEVYLTDNPDNPICLLYKQGDVFQVKIVKITVPIEKPVPQLEEQLAKQKKAIIYGIYFDFDKDTIKPESEPVLKEIVKAMTDNPDWKLHVDGHTDNIGGGAHNLDLSKRRAASVKSALVERYHISADRLTTNGFGASSPIDRNDTLEGRARNRRVELSRE